MCCTLESTLSSEELFLEQAFPRKSIVSEDVKFPARFPPLLYKLMTNNPVTAQSNAFIYRSGVIIK